MMLYMEKAAWLRKKNQSGVSIYCTADSAAQKDSLHVVGAASVADTAST
jgi:hypothetical protein